jgi:hypothetical protein
MNEKKIALYLFGYSCSGKSNVEALIREKLSGLYTVDYDIQKRQLAGYHRNKDRAGVREITRGLFEIVCKTGRPVLLASMPLENEGEYLAYVKITQAYGYELHSFEFTAARDTLIARYRERLEEYSSKGEGDALKSEAQFLETLSKPNFVPENTVTFDTTATSSEEITHQILALIAPSAS